MMPMPFEGYMLGSYLTRYLPRQDTYDKAQSPYKVYHNHMYHLDTWYIIACPRYLPL